MDWLFGCFGGAGKKARKPAASQKACQGPFQPLPTKDLPPPSIPIPGFSFKEEDLLQERNSASHASAKNAEGTFQKSSERTPEKLEKGDPWSQLDDLEEELEDLRKQIQQETIDAKKIKEQVSFLRSCGTLLQTPAEFRKNGKTLEARQEGTPSKGWHSWLVLPSLPPSKQLCAVPPECQDIYEGMEAVLSPVDATHDMQHSVQSLIIENKKDGKEFNSEPLCISRNGPEQQINQQMEDGMDTSIDQNPDAASGHHFEDHVDFASSSNKPGSPCKDVTMGVPSALAKQCSTISRNVSLKCMEGAPIALPRDDNSHVHVQCTKDAITMNEIGSSNLNLFEASMATLSVKEGEKTSDLLEEVCTIDAVQAPWNGKSAHWRNASNTNFEVPKTPRFSKDRYNMYQSSECALHTVSSSISSMGMTESGTCQSSFCHDQFQNLVSGQKHQSKEDEDLAGRSCFVRSKHSQIDALMVDSDETLTDLSSTEESMGPSETPQSRIESVISCEGEDSSSSFYAEDTASTSLYSHGSTQNSVAQTSRTTEEAASYDSELSERKDNLLFADASSHVSAECSHLQTADRNEQSRFVRQQTQSATPIKVMQWQDTPEPPRPFAVKSRPASPVLTPVENALQWRQLKFQEENLEKVLDSNDTNNAKSGIHCQSHVAYAFTDRSIIESAMDPKREEGWDENDEPKLQGIFGCMHAQHAHMEFCKDPLTSEITHNSIWLTTPQPVTGSNFDNSTTLPRWRNVFGVQTTGSSPWTRKLVNDSCEEFTLSSNDAIEPTPVRVDLSLSTWLHVPFKQDELKDPTINPAGLVMQQSPARCRNERPILGLITGDMNSNSATRKVTWDGKGIPNTTNKYKEDQRVNWHATPFEARLDRALNRKAYEDTESTPVLNRLKSLQ